MPFCRSTLQCNIAAGCLLAFRRADALAFGGSGRQLHLASEKEAEAVGLFSEAGEVQFQGLDQQAGPAEHVNPFIGSANHGHTFPGATTPWGMVQVTPWGHGSNAWDTESGYSTDVGELTFFGMAHSALSGAGSGELGELRLRPALQDGSMLIDREASRASPGIFSTRVSHTGSEASGGSPQSFIGIESTATARGAVHEFSFPDTSKDSALQRRVALHLEPPPEAFYGLRVDDLWVKNVDQQRVEGCTLALLMGWGAPPSHMCFVVEFDEPFVAHSSTRGDDGVVAGFLELQSGEQLGRGDGEVEKPTGLVLTFQGASAKPLTARVGISRTDIEHARQNFAAEVKGKSLLQVHDAAKEAWNKELGAVKVDFGDSKMADKQSQKFYTALYHSMIAPNLLSDADGSFRLAALPEGDSHAPAKGDPYYWTRHGGPLTFSALEKLMPVRKAKSGTQQYGTFSVWDTYRSLHPLYNLVAPERARDFGESLMTFAEEWKMLPHSLVFASTSDMMNGDGGAVVLAGIARTGLVDRAEALRLLNSTRRHHVETMAMLEDSPRKADMLIEQGVTREAAEADKNLLNGPKISKALENGLADSCVARLADDIKARRQCFSDASPCLDLCAWALRF
eukprot:TRINITY_DN19167_c0_g1_i1.p1 TRINITY_DN19167_c0_g1~~TRINITY_DN19167_c0_g1_i1.p1  ORF type:complete len:624 (+),score=158.87 TRINITY_DN19167_c0_g1_i1:137-2008(+)